MGNQGVREMMVELVSQDSQAFLGSLVSKDSQACLDNKGYQEETVYEGNQANVESLVEMAFQVEMGSLALMVCRARQDNKAMLAHQEKMVFVELQDQQEQEVLLGDLVKGVLTVKEVHLVEMGYLAIQEDQGIVESQADQVLKVAGDFQGSRVVMEDLVNKVDLGDKVQLVHQVKTDLMVNVELLVRMAIPGKEAFRVHLVCLD